MKQPGLDLAAALAARRLIRVGLLRLRQLAGAAACGLLGGCASAALSTRVAADQAAGDVALSSAHDETPLARQAAASPPGSRGDADRRAASQVARPVLRRSAASWVASVNVPKGSEEGLPSIFVEPISLTFDDAATGGMVSIRTMADRITSVTGVPVRLQQDVFAGPDPTSQANVPPSAIPLASVPAPVPAPVLAGALPVPAPLPGLAPAAEGFLRPIGSPAIRREMSVQAVPMRWSGSLAAYLDMITDRLGLAWEFRDGIVVVERLRTEYFEVASLDGEVDYKLGLNGNDQASANNSTSGSGGGSSSMASTSNEVSERGWSNIAASILTTVQQIVKEAPGSSVVRLDGSGRIAVTSTKDRLARVRDFVRAENESLLRQAQVQFDIYSITRSESDEQGIDWEAVVSALGGAYTGSIQSPATLAGSMAGNVGFAILTPSQSGVRNSVTTHFGGSSAILKMLNEYGGSTQHREVSLLALNRTWDRKSSLGGRAYVSSTVPGASSTAGVGAPGLVTSTVTTGDRYLAQPYILDNDTVLLKFGIGLSSLVNLANFTSGTGSAEQTVQTPETTAIDDQATVALKAGQILVITGLSRIVTSDDRRSPWDRAPVALGGSRTQGRMKEEFIIFVRPTIL